MGAAPAMIPVKLSLQSDRGLKKSFEFQVVNDQVFTPLFTYAAILSTLGTYERETGAASFSVKGTMSVKQQADIQIEDLFTGDRAAMNASASVLAPLTFLLGNDFEPVDIQRL